MTADRETPRIGFRKILYLTDLSESGRQAFPYAASLAQTYGAELTVLHIVESHDLEKYLVGYISEPLWNEIKQGSLEEARETLLRRKRDDATIRDNIDTHCQDALPGESASYVSYDVAVETGDTVDKVLEKADKEGYDLIVIGKHGHGALKGALIGDTAQRILRRTTKPVLVVEVPPKDDD
jgi:nucleotide-binding universal stress UspA family protein